MQQNLHVLYQLLVPALFLVLWALNQLFNKEIQGGNRPGGGLGPRPGGVPPTNRPRPQPAFRPEPIGARPETEDEILVLKSEPPSRPSTPPPAPGRRPPRSSQGRPGKRGLAPSPVGKAMDTRTGHPGSLAQASGLTTQITQLARVSSIASDRSAHPADTPSSALPPISLSQLRQSLSDHARLREAFVLQEVLQPPVFLRGRR